MSDVTFNRLENYVPVAPFWVIWALEEPERCSAAGPFERAHDAMLVKIRIGAVLKHDSTWQSFYLVDGNDVIIAGYFCSHGVRSVAVPPRMLKPALFLTPDEEKAYEQWRATMTRIADESALAEIEEGLA